MATKPQHSEYPKYYYHPSGRTQLVKAPDQIPTGEGWQDKPCPAKAKPASDIDVNQMPHDQAISHMKDQVSELQQENRNLKAEIEWNKRRYDNAYSDQGEKLSRALVRIAELEDAASPKKSKKSE